MSQSCYSSVARTLTTLDLGSDCITGCTKVFLKHYKYCHDAAKAWNDAFRDAKGDRVSLN